MAKVAAQYASKYRPRELRIINRTLPRARSLVDHLGMGSAHSWQDLEELLLETDIVLSSTSSLHSYYRFCPTQRCDEKTAGVEPFFW